MLGIFGGSFDPLHFGHIKSVLALLERYEFSEIRFIPCKQSPLKDGAVASGRHRWEMLNLFTQSMDKLSVDDIELKRDGPSFTIDTVKEIYESLNNEYVLVLILGIDTYLEFCKWKNYNEILSYCHVMILQRPGYILPNDGCEQELFMKYAVDDINKLNETKCGHIFLSDVKKIDISATQIRAIISNGGKPKYLIPGNIWNYIRRNKLYLNNAK